MNCYFCAKPALEDGSTIHHPNCAGLEDARMNNLQVHGLQDRIRALAAELAEAKRQLSLSGSARIAMLSARVEKLETALRYWFPDETLIPEGHEVAWNEHVQLIPEHRLTAETAAESFERLQREQGIRSGSVTDGKVPQ